MVGVVVVRVRAEEMRERDMRCVVDAMRSEWSACQAMRGCGWGFYVNLGVVQTR